MNASSPSSQPSSQPSRAVEAYVRRAWEHGPGPVLRVVGSAYGLGIAMRHRLYEMGILRVRQPALPVVSVGGVTVGGSGKTPVAARIATWLIEDGFRVGIATHGFVDEIGVHRRLNPAADVDGGSDRRRVIEGLAARGSQVVVLDDGFQRRKLGRSLDVVVVDAETLAGQQVRYLPAGPYRERLEELRRATAIVVTRRAAAEPVAIEVANRLRGRFPHAAMYRCALSPGPLVAVNRAAAAVAPPAPTVAVAAVMKADLALAQMRDQHPSLIHLHPFSDHARLDFRTVAELTRQAGSDGIVGTLKDIDKLGETLGEATPLWYMADELEWESDPETLRERVREVAEGTTAESTIAGPDDAANGES